MLDFTIVPPFAAAILTGALWTIIIAASAAVISFAGGVLIALATLYAPRIAQYPVRFVSWVLMGTPLLLQLYFIYYGLSQIGVNIPAIWTGIIGLGLHFAIYNDEITILPDAAQSVLAKTGHRNTVHWLMTSVPMLLTV